MIIIDDNSICFCGSYYQSNKHCTNGHKESVGK